MAGQSASQPLKRYLRPPYLFGFAVLLALMAVPLCLRRPADWNTVYVPAAARLLAGESIYQDGFVYPPVNALLAVPVLKLSPVAGTFVWYAASALGLLVLIRGAWMLSGSKTDQGPPRHDWLILIAGCTCGMPFAFDCLSNRQTDLGVAGLTLAGCLALWAGRDVRAGAWFGLAAGLKCTPLLWAPYLLVRRRFRAAAVIAAVAVGVNLLPDLLFPNAGASRLSQWRDAFITPMTNHSLAGVCYRWLTLDRVVVDGRATDRVSPKRVSPSTLKLAVYGADAALVLAAVVVALRRPGRGERSDVLEYCLVLLLMLLLSPQSSKPHFCTLMLPGFCLARTALVRRDVAGGLIVAAAVGCALLSNKDLWGVRIYETALWYSTVFAAAGLLFVDCLRARWQRVAPIQVAGTICPAHGLDAVA
jgi:hypothetical protein